MSANLSVVSVKRLAAGLVASVLLLLPARALAAQPQNSAAGISISPFLQQIAIQPGEASKIFNVQLTNHTKNLQELNLSARDFGSLNETGGILLEGSKGYTQKYGLTSWMTLGADTVVLQPNESHSVPVTITNRDSLQPGGHYGAVAVSVKSLDEQGGNRVAIKQQLLSLVLVDKVGGEHYNLKLSGIEQNGNWLHLPNTIKLRFQNPGNVHVIPRGIVRLKSPSGTVLAQGVINSESAFVLPESFRQLYVPLTPVNRALPLPGLYHVEVQYRYEGIQQYAKKSYVVHFISLGLYVCLLLLALIVWRLVKRHKQPTKKAN